MTIRIQQNTQFLRLFTISTSSLWFFFFSPCLRESIMLHRVLFSIQFTVIYLFSGLSYIDTVVISIQTGSCHGHQCECMVSLHGKLMVSSFWRNKKCSFSKLTYMWKRCFCSCKVQSWTLLLFFCRWPHLYFRIGKNGVSTSTSKV